jgi:uncharacterized protein (DUF1330 family)
MTAYVIFTRERTTDAAELKLYGEKAGAAREGHALTPLAFYGKVDMLEGEPIEGCVVLSFPTMAEAHAWYDSPIYQAAREHRLKGSDYRIFIAEGVDAA